MNNFVFDRSMIAYRKEGQGKVVVLIHGFGEDGNIWNEQAKVLSQQFLVIILDLPGSGSSSMLQKQEVSMEDYADGLYALLQHEKVSSCVLLGHSMGGYISLAFAHKYPAMLEGFGLIHSTALADNEEKKEVRSKGITFIQQYGPAAFLKTSIPNLFAESSKTRFPEAINRLVEEGRHFSPEALIMYYKAMMQRPDTTEVLRKSKVPVLFVAGTEDKAVPLQDVLRQVHLPPVSFFHVFEKTGHMSMIENTGALNGAITEFLSEVYPDSL